MSAHSFVPFTSRYYPPMHLPEAIHEMGDSQLMAWAVESRYDDGAEPEAVRRELDERGYTEDDIASEYDRELHARFLRRQEAAREYGELMGIEGVD